MKQLDSTNSLNTLLISPNNDILEFFVMLA
jgi:hypothetical protein